MDEYKPNSHRSRSEGGTEKRADKMVVGPVKVRKKNGIAKLADAFLTKDVDSVKTYVVMDIIIPKIKKAASDIVSSSVDMISDVLKNGIDMILFGEVRGERKNHNTTKSHYRSYYDRRGDDRREPSYQRTRSGYSYEEIVFDYRSDAKRVLDGLYELIADFRIATVANLFEMADRTPDYTAHKYGWTDISSAGIVQVRDGYILKLPKAMPLD